MAIKSGSNVWKMVLAGVILLVVTLQAGAATTALADPASPIAVTKTANPSPVVSGGLLTYTITMVNTGGAKLTNLVMTDQVNGVGVNQTPPALPQLTITSSQGNCTQGGPNGNVVTCNGGTLNGGASWTVTIAGQVTASNGATLNNTAAVSGTKSAQTFNTTATVQVPVQGGTGGGSPQPDLTINKTGPSSVAAASPLTYTLTVNNVGTANTANVKVVDTLPAGVTSASASGTSLFVCNVSGQTVTCTGGTVNAGANATITINATAPALAGSITNTAVVDPDNTIAESNELNNTSASVNTSVGAPPSGPLLDIKKSDGSPAPGGGWWAGAGPDPVTPGQQITYKIQVTNNATGTNSRADDVIVTDGTQGLEASSITATQVIVSGTVGNTGGCVVNAPQVRCNIRSLNSGGTLTITIKGTVISSAGSTIFNTATVTGNIKNTGVTNTASEATTVKPAVDLTITKGDTPDPVCARSWPTDAQHLGQPAGAPAAAGTPPGLLAAPVCLGGLTYSFVVGNSGIAQATGVMVRDALPAGLIFDSYESTAGFVCAVDGSNAVTCTGGTIDAESTRTLTFRVVAPPSLGVITNSITIDPNNSIFEPDETNNTATTTTNVATGVDLVVWKSDSNADDPPGVGAPSLTEGTATNLGDGYDPIATRGTQTVTIYVDNVGTQDTTGIRLRDTLPADTIFLSATSDPQHGFTCSHNGAATGGTVECTGGHLLGTAVEFYEEAGAPGPVPAGDQFATIKIRFFARASVGSMLNEVRVDPLNEIAEANELNNTATDTTTVTAGDADKGAYHQLTVAKSQTSPGGPVATNGILIYDLTVSNLGTDPISNVIVRDTLPSGTRFIEVKDTGGNTADGFSCVHDGAATGGVITCSGGDLNGSINQIPGVSGAQRHITIKVFAPNTPGGITNQAEVDPNNLVAEGNEFDNNTQANTTVAPCVDQAACTAGNAVYELTILKDQDRATIARNGLETYTLLVTNLGSDPVSDIKVVDILPAGTRFFDAKDTAVPPSNPAAFTCSHDGSATSGIVTCTGGDLSGTDGSLAVAGVPTSRSIQIRAFMPDTPGTYTNRSVVDPDNAIPEGNEFNNESSIQTAVQNGGPNPYIDLTVDKTQVAVNDPDQDHPFAGEPNPKDAEIVRVDTGSGVLYQLKVSNLGEADAYNVTVRDVMPVGMTYFKAQDPIGPGNFTCGLVPAEPHTIECTGGTIPAGGSRNIDVILVAPTGLDQIALNQQAISQIVINTAFVDPGNEFAEGDESNNTDTFSTKVESQVNLTLEKEGPDNASPNTEDNYVITVKNNKVWGDGRIASDVVVVDSLPVGLIPLWVMATPGNFDCAILENPVNNVRCVGDLEPDQTVTITIHVFVTQQSGTMDNEACIDPGHTIDETNELDNCDTKTTAIGETPPTPKTAPNLNINKSVDKGSVTAGESLTYTLNINNTGDGNADGPVTVTDTLPPATVATFANANPDAAFTCADPVGGVLTCTAAAGLAPGTGGQITILMTVVDPLPAGTTSIVNTATVEPGLCAAADCENEAVDSTRLINNSASATSTVGGSPIDLQVVSVTDATDATNRASQLTYTIIAQNNGTAAVAGAAEGGLVRVELSAGPTVQGVTGTNGFVCTVTADPSIYDCVGTFQPSGTPGDNTIITAIVTVDTDAGNTLHTTATVDPDDAATESDETNNSKTEPTTVTGSVCTASPCVDLVVTEILDDPDPATEPGTIVYTVSIVNVGDTALSSTAAWSIHIQYVGDGDASLSGAIQTNAQCFVAGDPADRHVHCNSIAGAGTDVMDLGAGEGLTFTITITGATAGTKSLTVSADEPFPHGAGVIDEFSETNNAVTESTTVLAP